MYEIYRISMNGSLEEWSNNLNVPVDVLKQINGFDDNTLLESDDLIIIPKRGEDNFTYYTVQKGDTIIAIARNYGLDYEQLLDLNGLDKEEYIYEGQRIMIPRNGTAFWITRDGNTLNDVAQKFGTTIQDVINDNTKIYLRPDQLLIFKKKD